MPELPEVETVRLGLLPAMEGARFGAVDLRRGDLRTAFPARFAARLTGRTIAALRRRGKFLLADLDDGAVLVMHLGMSGSFRIETEGGVASTTPGVFHHGRGKRGAHDHVVFHMSSGARVVFNDPRRFGMMTLLAPGESLTALGTMGVEPLGADFTGATLARVFAGRTAPVKALLMDQRRIAGLGNIYACEALWRARISPDRPAGRFATARGQPTVGAERLATAIREVLEDAIAAGGSSLRDHVQADGRLGSFQHHFAVYGREGKPCKREDRGVIRRAVHAGRSTFYCPVCQR